VTAPNDRALEAEREAAHWREKAVRAEHALRRAEQASMHLKATAAAAEADANLANQRLVAILNSTSWRITRPVRAVVEILREVSSPRNGVKRIARPVLARGAAYLHAHPLLKKRVADTLRRFPGLRARLVGIVGNEAALGAASASVVIESVEQLTARARTVYQDLLQAKHSNRR
jgi:hypothetical protein